MSKRRLECGACDGLATGGVPSPSTAVAEPAREPGPPDMQALERGLGGKAVLAVLEKPEPCFVRGREERP